MTNTPFSKQVEIIAEAFLYWDGEDYWDRFFAEYDMGSYLSFFSQQGYAQITDEGKAYVTQTWNALCDRLGIDSYAEYYSFENFLDIAEIDNEG